MFLFVTVQVIFKRSDTSRLVKTKISDYESKEFHHGKYWIVYTGAQLYNQLQKKKKQNINFDFIDNMTSLKKSLKNILKD